ncbi:MAG: D-alanine--D-alanine ligase [Actinobacteria bacterium]|nr:D-alanine--D-alanine ligase [Actinomycetota bacterium]
MPRVRVALICGGQSSEHGISCVSTGSVLAAIDRERFDVTVLGITRDGGWRVMENPDFDLRGDLLPEITDATHSALAGPALLDGFDVVFPLLHGAYGEDGAIQGLMESAKMRYVGSGVLASAASMEKSAMKQLLTSAELPTPDHVSFRFADWVLDPVGIESEITEHLPLPVFVKPSRAGSSQGISKVKSAAELGHAIAAAGEHDARIIVEEGVIGREVECAVLQNAQGEIMVSIPGEILVDSKYEFYDYAAKYFDDGTTLTIPAELDSPLVKEIQSMAQEAFIALGCEGLARVDFFLTAEGPLINEVNTMPGFTPTSMYPRLWDASGVSYAELISILIDEALARPTTILR